MNEVRVLVLTNFTYTYGASNPSYKQCGESMYFNPSLSKELEELKFILESSYMKKGWLYIENNIIEDFKNRVGIFTNIPKLNTEIKIDYSEIKYPVSKNIENIVEESKEIEVSISLEARKIQLQDMKVYEIKKIAEELGLKDYTNKVNAIEYILEKEYK